MDRILPFAVLCVLTPTACMPGERADLLLTGGKIAIVDGEFSVHSTIAEIQELIRRKAAELGEGEWITGYGWSEDELAERRRPLRPDLDEFAPRNPVLLTRAGAHSAVANSLALELAGIDRSTPQPGGGVIEYDEDGELNGVIRERQGMMGGLEGPRRLRTQHRRCGSPAPGRRDQGARRHRARSRLATRFPRHR